MTREERTTAMDKAMEAAARALSPHLRFYGDGHGHAVTIAGKTIKAFLAALEAAGVKLVYPSEAPAQLIDNDERTTVTIFTPYAPQKDETND